MLEGKCAIVRHENRRNTQRQRFEETEGVRSVSFRRQNETGTPDDLDVLLALCARDLRIELGSRPMRHVAAEVEPGSQPKVDRLHLLLQRRGQLLAKLRS